MAAPILSVIMPVYNEEKTLQTIIERVLRVPFLKELIVVNDASTDHTASILRSYQNHPSLKIVHHERNRGKGAAIRTGIAEITGNVVVIQDGDLEYDPNDFGILIEPILQGKEKVVYGSRFLYLHEDPESHILVLERPDLRIALRKIVVSMVKNIVRSKILRNQKEQPHTVFFFGGLVVTIMTNVLYGQQLTDEPTCYKMFDADLLKSIPLQCERFEFCPEVTAKVAKRGIKIREIPIHYSPRKVEEGKKIKWYDGVEAIWTLLKYRFVD